MLDQERIKICATKNDYVGEACPQLIVVITDEDIARDVAEYFKSRAIDILKEDAEKEAEEFLHACNEIKAGCERVFNNVEESEETKNEPIRD